MKIIYSLRITAQYPEQFMYEGIGKKKPGDKWPGKKGRGKKWPKKKITEEKNGRGKKWLKNEKEPHLHT